MVYTIPQQFKKEESEELRGERGQIKFIDLRFERGKIVVFWERKKKARHSINCTVLSL